MAQFIVTRSERDQFCTLEELRTLARDGKLAPGDLVYHPQLGRRMYAREVEEIREELTAGATLGRAQKIVLKAPRRLAVGTLGIVCALVLFSTVRMLRHGAAG